MKRWHIWFGILFPSLFVVGSGVAQDKNIPFDIPELEYKMRYEPFEVRSLVGIRYDNDFTKRAVLRFRDGTKFRVKWKRAVDGGDAPNNAPRYEIAAYEFQKLFLDPGDYVVPPTAGRSLPLAEYRKLEPDAKPTFKGIDAVFFVIQFWLHDVTDLGVFDEKRVETNPSYARHLGNLNLFTYLVKHNDSNVGNVLISIYGSNMRLFSVDNSLTFGDLTSNRGNKWRKLRLKRYPRETIERLKRLTPEDIRRALSVVAQYEVRGNELVPVAPTEPLDKTRGVRRSGNIIQFGLTEREIEGVILRWRRLLDLVASGKITTFASPDESGSR